MIKKLSKFGNSKALIIDKAILRLLNIDEKTELEITIKGTSIIISPVKKGGKRKVSKNKKLQEVYEEIIDKYADDLKKMAD